DVRGEFRKAREIVIGAVDHQMHVARLRRHTGRGGAKGRSKRAIVHEVAVHDIEVMPVRARGFRTPDFVVQTAKITGEDGMSDENGMHGNAPLAYRGGGCP